jgi:hypothetical protein
MPQWAHVSASVDEYVDTNQRSSQSQVDADAGTGNSHGGALSAVSSADVGADGGTGGTASPSVSWRPDSRVPERRHTDPSIVPPKRDKNGSGSVTPRGKRSITPDFGGPPPRNEVQAETTRQPAQIAQRRMGVTPFGGEKISSQDVLHTHPRKGSSDSTSAPPATQRHEVDKLPNNSNGNTAARKRAKSPISECSTSTGAESDITRGPSKEEYKEAGMFGSADFAKIWPFESEARERGQRQTQQRHRPGPHKDASPRARPRGRALSAPSTNTDAAPITPRGQAATPRGAAHAREKGSDEELDEPPLYLGRLRNRVFLHGASDLLA